MDKKIEILELIKTATISSLLTSSEKKEIFELVLKSPKSTEETSALVRNFLIAKARLTAIRENTARAKQ